MSEKQGFISKVIQRFAAPQLQEVIKERVQEELNKASSGDILRFSPQSLSFPTGSIQKPYLTGVSFGTLRSFADYYPVARAAIEFRKSQITHLEWNITPVELNDETVQDKKNIADAKVVKTLLKHPTGKKDSSFTNWLKQVLEDLLVIDAVAIYKRKNRRGDIIGYLPIDGASIELILEQDGTTPEPPKEAYIQKIQGQEKARLTSDELIYAMMTPKTYSAYGFAPLETLIITVTTALKLQSYNLSYLSEGNTPEGFITLPKDIASSRDQLKEWQEAWDAMLSGDPRFQRKLKFLPEGMSYEPTIKQSDMTFERFEKFLLQSTCSVFGIHPSAIGFNFDVNRATAESSFEAGRERGLFPTALFLKEIMDRIVQDDLGYENLQFSWANINPTNRAEEAKVVTSLVNAGLMSIDEWRLGEGLKPTGIKDPFLMTPIGPIFVKDLLRQSESGQLPVAPYKPVTEQKPSSAENTRNLPIPSQAKADIDFAQEIRKWRKSALNDLKKGRAFRDFYTETLDFRTQELIKRDLAQAKTKEDITKVFEVFLQENQKLAPALLNLYARINQAIGDEPKGTIASTVTSA